jgi:hypothetical protein
MHELQREGTLMMADEEQKDVTIGAPAADAGDEPAPVPEDESASDDDEG